MVGIAAIRIFVWAACTSLAGAIRLGHAGPNASCASVADATAITAAEEMIIKANAKLPAPKQVETRHMVLISPSKPLEAGDVAAEAFAGLPKKIDEQGMPVAEFTKYVLVGYAPEGGPDGISIGSDVCGGSGFADDDAAKFLQEAVPEKFRSRAPVILDCVSRAKKKAMGEDIETCAGMSDNLIGQLPFLQAVSNGRLAGNVLPVMIQKQDAMTAASLGDSLALLVGESGVWEGQRVLFVFGTDLSHGLSSDLAADCDQVTAKMLVEKTAAEVAGFFRDLKSGQAGSWCSSDNALPPGRSSVVAALRVAETLFLRTTHRLVSNNALVLQEKERIAAAEAAAAVAAGVAVAAQSANASNTTGENATTSESLKPEDVVGFASILFWDDTMTVNERIGSMTPSGFLQKQQS